MAILRENSQFESAIKQADELIYDAKGAGRNLIAAEPI
jgi:PleD family two-component response regulator